MIRTVKLERVFDAGESTPHHRLIAEWHETVGIGYPKDALATCYASEKDIWPALRALQGQRVWLRLRGDRIVGVEPEKPGRICFEAVGWELEDGRFMLDVPPWDKEQKPFDPRPYRLH